MQVLYIDFCLPHLSLSKPFRIRTLARTSADMEKSTLFEGDDSRRSILYSGLPEESTLQLAAKNTALMDMIYGILERGDGPTSPHFPTPIEQDLSKAKVLQWASSLSQYSPVDEPPPPIFPEYDHEIPRSPSPMGSMLSDTSSHGSSSGPKTPALSIRVPTADDRFSWERAEKTPEPTMRTSSASLTVSVPPRHSSHNRTDSSPSPSPRPAMTATITSLVDDFMPGFVPDFEPSVVKAKSAKPPVLRISTAVLPYPATPISRRPELVYPPALQPGSQASHLVAQQSSTRGPSLLRRSSEIRNSPLKNLHGGFSSLRQSVNLPPKQKMINQERQHVQARQSRSPSPKRHSHADSLRVGPRPPALSVVIEERPQIPDAGSSVCGKPYDNRDQYRRMSSTTPLSAAMHMMTPAYLRKQSRHSMVSQICNLGQPEQYMPSPTRAPPSIPVQVGQKMRSPTRPPPGIPSQIEQKIPSPTRPPPRVPSQVEQKIVSPTRLAPTAPAENGKQIAAQVRHSLMPSPNRFIEIEQQKSVQNRHSLPAPTRRTQNEIEAIPEPASAKSEPASLGTNLGIGTRGLFAGERGLQFTMSRRVITMSKMEWEILSPGGSRLLNCYEHTNSLSRRRDFFDVQGSQLFDFQRRIGSTRTAQCPKGSTLFVVKNASLHRKIFDIIFFLLILT
jgi:hypothetical protein